MHTHTYTGSSTLAWHADFDGEGRAEVIRLALLLGGVPFEDIRLSVADWMARKNAGKAILLGTSLRWLAQHAGIQSYLFYTCLLHLFLLCVSIFRAYYVVFSLSLSFPLSSPSPFYLTQQHPMRKRCAEIQASSILIAK